MLQDNSEDHKETWNFLERRIEDAIQLRRVISIPSDIPPPDQALTKASEAASAAFITVNFKLINFKKKFNLYFNFFNLYLIF